MLVDWLYVAVFGVVGVLLAILPLAIVWLISPRGEYPQKLLTYESGVVPFGQAWSQFNVRYYLFSLAFVLFDVEVIYLYPWAIVFKELGAVAFMEMFVFLAILFLAFIYAWRKGALEWV